MILPHYDLNTTAGCRDYAILMILLDTGLRCSEPVNLKLDNANINDGYVAHNLLKFRTLWYNANSWVISGQDKLAMQWRFPQQINTTKENLLKCLSYLN